MSKTELSWQQRRIVPLVAQGLTDQEIASLLELSKNSVSQSIKEIFRKFEFRNRVELTLWLLTKPKVEPYALPARTHVCEMQHKYNVGDKVHITKPHMMSGAKGEICALVPHTFIAPGYYVKVNGMVFAVSERSIGRIEESMSYEIWCKHYNGLHSKICRAGVDYKDVKDPEGPPLNLPCFKDQGCTERCSLAVFRTPEEVAEEEEKSNEAIKAYLDNLKNDICPHCHTPIEEQKQVGRCVYAVPCGHRLYQGITKKKQEERRKEMEEMTKRVEEKRKRHHGQDESPSQNALF